MIFCPKNCAASKASQQLYRLVLALVKMFFCKENYKKKFESRMCCANSSALNSNLQVSKEGIVLWIHLLRRKSPIIYHM